jgi:adenosine deaminase
MRHGTMLELAQEHGVRLPEALRSELPMRLDRADERGWFRFQRLYDTARSVLRREGDVRRLLTEVALDERADGSGWLEIQVDPSGYAATFGGLTAFTELVLDAVASASAEAGVGIGVVIGANRTRHPLDARTLARLAVQYAGHGVVGFGLANDERRGPAEEFATAFRIARTGGLLAVPHAGELSGPASVLASLDALGADRIGHGVRSAEDPQVLQRLATAGVTCEICPTSNVALGVYRELADVPLLTLLEAGVPVALGADDPLLFGSRLTAQYEGARTTHLLDDTALAELARMSVRASRAPADVRAGLLTGIDAWMREVPSGRAATPTA